MSLREEYRRFKTSTGSVKASIAKSILKELIKFSGEEPYWERVEGELKIKEYEAKEVLLFLESIGEIKIRRSKNGRRLYVLTLKT